MNPIFRSHYRPSTHRGLVLVIVLWIVSLLSVMAGAFAYSMRVETQLATSSAERARARALAEAGLAYATAWQRDPEVQKQWPPNGDPHDWLFGGGRVRIQVVDAAGFVNLNTANLELVGAMLAAGGMEGRDRDSLAAAIVDWRNPDENRTPNGAKNAEYRAAGLMGPKNAPFESIEELQQVLGMTREVYQRIAGMVTVFSYHSSVNPELAPASLLQALGVDERIVAEYVETRTRAAANGSAPPPFQVGSRQSFFLPGRANVYHIAITAETETGIVASIQAVAGMQGTFAGQSWRLLSWREGR